MNAIEKLKELGLTHWWNFDNNYLEWFSGTNNSLTNNLGVSFVSDRKNSSLRAVYLTKGKMTIPTDIYFHGGDLSITVWVNVLNYKLLSETGVDCGYHRFLLNVIDALEKNMTNHDYFKTRWHSDSLIPLKTWTHLAATLLDSTAII